MLLMQCDLVANMYWVDQNQSASFQASFSVTYFGEIFDIRQDIRQMLHFQYILKLITCHASYRSSDTKQWHAL